MLQWFVEHTGEVLPWPKPLGGLEEETMLASKRDLQEGCWAISGSNVVEALEAAHILPHRGLETNHVSNGLLLRADIHTLFDLGHITIDAVTWTIPVIPSLRGISYGEFTGRTVRLPRDTEAWPNEEALRLHRAWSGL